LDPSKGGSMPFDHSSYISPFSWRYGSQSMRKIWSEAHKRRLLRRVWVALAKAQNQAGLVSVEQLADLQKHVDKVDIERSLEIESQIHHDVMAELKTFAEECPIGGSILHLGATSADIQKLRRQPQSPSWHLPISNRPNQQHWATGFQFMPKICFMT
jgi:hypothetical protein